MKNLTAKEVEERFKHPLTRTLETELLIYIADQYIELLRRMKT